MKYIVWVKRKYASWYEKTEFPSMEAVASALINGEFYGTDDVVITRRMKITVVDAEEAETKPPVAASLEPPVAASLEPPVAATVGEEPLF